MVCENCGRNIPQELIWCIPCLSQFIQEQIEPLRPSNTDESCQALYPEAINANIADYIEKDINELLDCLSYELWTACVVMSARILETIVRDYYAAKIGEEVPINFAQVIKGINSAGIFSAQFIQLLDELRELRNDAMHGERRFSPDESISTCKKVLAIVAFIANFRD
nr:DUF4145 domain-containing protein [Candidatus Sigynarchaeota archaeon]